MSMTRSRPPVNTRRTLRELAPPTRPEPHTFGGPIRPAAPSKPPPPQAPPDRARLDLTINGTVYTLRIYRGALDNVYHLRKHQTPEGEVIPAAARPVYHVTHHHADSGDVECDCPSSKYSPRDVCKHVRALAALDIIPNP